MNIERLDGNGIVRKEFYDYAVECYKGGIEIWVDIDGYDGLYQISNFARVKTLPHEIYVGHNTYRITSEKVLKLKKTKKGYFLCTLFKHGTRKIYFIHRLVGLIFIPNPLSLPEINHINGIKSDNFQLNLEWCTSSENKLHAFKIGLRVPTCFWLGKLGKDHNSSKPIIQLNKKFEIINEFSCAAEASRKTGICRSNINSCSNGKLKTAGKYIWKLKSDYYATKQ